MTESQDVTTEAYHYPLLVHQLWHAPLTHSPEQEIVYADRARFTYRQLRERVGRLGTLLRGLGVKSGDTVAVMDWDSNRYLECYYAVPMLGAVLMTVNVRLSPEQIMYTINHSRATVLLTHAHFQKMVESLWPRFETVRQVIWLTDEDTTLPTTLPCAGEYETLLAASQPLAAFPEFDENTRATTFYTTGTTGLPKGVHFSHRQLVLHTLAGMAALASPASAQRFHRGDVYMPLTPMFHVHAWGVPYIALQLGVKQVYPGRYQAESIVALIEREGVTFSHCVPTILQMVLSCPSATEVDLSRWKVVIGGSALSAGLARQALARGIDIFGGYGMSETCPLLTLAQLSPGLGALHEEREILFRCKAGAPVPLVELRTVDPEMNDVPNDGRSTGEVVVRAPWLTQGYTRRPDESAQLWAGGYLHTQDVGYLESGYLKITDRIKDVIKTGGEWVSSLEVEDLISRHPAVRECAVIGIPDARWGERPLAVVVADVDMALDEEAVRQQVAQFCESGQISKFAIPSRVVFLDAIPRTSVGKLDKKRLREMVS